MPLSADIKIPIEVEMLFDLHENRIDAGVPQAGIENTHRWV